MSLLGWTTMQLARNIWRHSHNPMVLASAACLAFAGMLSGCGPYLQQSKAEVAAGAKQSVHLKQGAQSEEDLERANRAFADRYVMRMSTACDLIIEGNKDEVQCRAARDLRA